MSSADDCVEAWGLTGICKEGEHWGLEVYSRGVGLELGFDYIQYIDVVA